MTSERGLSGEPSAAALSTRNAATVNDQEANLRNQLELAGGDSSGRAAHGSTLHGRETSLLWG